MFPCSLNYHFENKNLSQSLRYSLNFGNGSFNPPFHLSSWQNLRCLIPSIKCQLPQGSETNGFGFTLPYAADTRYIKPKCYHQPCPKGKRAEVCRIGNPVLKKAAVFLFCSLGLDPALAWPAAGLARAVLTSQGPACLACRSSPGRDLSPVCRSEREAGPPPSKICTFMH